MDISPSVLSGQVARARADWPFIDRINAGHRLPEGLLLAVGSRETNLTDEPGDAAPRATDPPNWPGKPYHAWSPWQIDMNSGGTPDLLNHPDQACATAAGMLRAHIDHFGGNLMAGVCAYNAGEGGAAAGIRDHGDPNAYTTGKDYGYDVLGRREWIAANTHPTSEESTWAFL